VKSRLLIRVSLFISLLLLANALVNAQETDQLCSVSDAIETSVVIVNRTQLPLDIYWVDYECKETLATSLPAGAVVVQPTFASHVWLARVTETGVQVGNLIVAEETPLVAEAACSIASDVETDLEIVNNSDVPLNIVWVDYECNEKPYQTLAPGEAVVQGTFDNTVWLLRDAETGTVVSTARVDALVAPATEE
jgi:hypothetical protein